MVEIMDCCLHANVGPIKAMDNGNERNGIKLSNFFGKFNRKKFKLLRLKFNSRTFCIGYSKILKLRGEIYQYA